MPAIRWREDTNRVASSGARSSKTLGTFDRQRFLSLMTPSDRSRWSAEARGGGGRRHAARRGDAVPPNRSTVRNYAATHRRTDLSITLRNLATYEQLSCLPTLFVSIFRRAAAEPGKAIGPIAIGVKRHRHPVRRLDG
jgi:hypothetical protein